MIATKPRRHRRPAIVAIDFEASSLPPGSFPIEVAVAYVSTEETRSWLIRPTHTWDAIGVWDPSSERLHGISRATVRRDGRPVKSVTVELAAAVADHIVVTDSVPADGYWLKVLFAAVGRRPPFQLEPYVFIIESLSRVKGSALSNKLRSAVDIARHRFPLSHRASPDARRLAEIVRIALGIA
jgi:DNA polymerase III epsilon subunit-like protein